MLKPTKFRRFIQCMFFSVLGLFWNSASACNAMDDNFLAQLNARVIVLGEVHGTLEMPEFAGNLFCHFAHQRQPVMLGLEMPEDMQPLLNEYVQSGATMADRIKLMSAPFWIYAGNSGQASTALFSLIEKARILKKQGYPVLLFAFDGSTEINTTKLTALEQYGYARDFIMAATIARRASQYREHKLIILTGNLHANKTVTEERMASFLERYFPVFSAKFVAAKGGQTWACIGKTPESKVCGLSAMYPESTTSETGFDTIIRLPEVHAAPPALKIPESVNPQ